jgi:hypothetical protein
MKKILFIGGSMNQTRMVYKVAKHLDSEYECTFTPMYTTGGFEILRRTGWLDFTVVGGQARQKTETFFRKHNLKVDYGGRQGDYDLVVTPPI